MKKTKVENAAQTNNIVKDDKKKHKINIKAWLFASIFSIISCCLGIANLVLNLTKR